MKEEVVYSVFGWIKGLSWAWTLMLPWGLVRWEMSHVLFIKEKDIEPKIASEK